MNNKLFPEINNSLPDATADALLVKYASWQMEGKLAYKRSIGFGGWHTRNCTIPALQVKLQEHVAKGDMVDVLNLAAMILVKQRLEEGKE